MAYTLASGASARKGVWVQVPPSAPSPVAPTKLELWGMSHRSPADGGTKGDSETVYSFGAFRQRRIRHSLIWADGWQASLHQGFGLAQPPLLKICLINLHVLFVPAHESFAG